MAFVVKFDRDALADLRSIKSYLARARGNAFADLFADRIIERCESLALVPHRGTRRDEILPGLRTLAWRKTITIAFRFRQEVQEIAVLGVLYRGRDIASALQRRIRSEP